MSLDGRPSGRCSCDWMKVPPEGSYGTYVPWGCAQRRSDQQHARTAWPTQIFYASALDKRRHDPLPSTLILSGPRRTLASHASGPRYEILMAFHSRSSIISPPSNLQISEWGPSHTLSTLYTKRQPKPRPACGRERPGSTLAEERCLSWARDPSVAG
jgi:hypothetical protein